MEPTNEVRHEKVLNDIVSDFRSQKNEKEMIKQEQEIKNSKRYCRRKWFSSVSRMILLCSLIYTIAVVAVELRLMQSRPYYSYGLRTGNEYKLNSCIYKMWLLRKAIDSFYGSYRRYPVSMDELQKSGFVSQKLLCPASLSEYKLLDRDGQKVFECADPNAHGVERVWAFIAGGPPVVEHQKVENYANTTQSL